MYQGGETALQAIWGRFDSDRVHQMLYRCLHNGDVRMKTANFPGRVKARREGALKRMEKGTYRPQREGEDEKAYAKYIERRDAEVATLKSRVH